MAACPPPPCRPAQACGNWQWHRTESTSRDGRRHHGSWHGYIPLYLQKSPFKKKKSKSASSFLMGWAVLSNAYTARDGPRWPFQRTRTHCPKFPTPSKAGTRNRLLPASQLPPVEIPSRPSAAARAASSQTLKHPCRAAGRPSSQDEPNRSALGSGTAVRRREFAEPPRPPAPPPTITTTTV